MGNVELICEIGINHNGDINLAKKLIDVACISGCDYVKFQKRTLESCYSKEELEIPRESPWGTTTREQKIGIELTVKDYIEIDKYCDEKGIKWFASPWDVKSVFHVFNCGACFIKVPSALLTNYEYLNVCIGTGLPIILSTGMSTEDQIMGAINVIGRNKLYAVLHCTSTYPTKDKELNLNYMPKIRDRFRLPDKVKVGFSNHSPGIVGMATAIALGAEILEFHITLDRSSYGSDQAASIEPEGVLRIAKYAKSIPNMLGDGKKVVYESEKPIMAKLRRG